MKNIEKALKDWISNPKRKYIDGLVLFETLATDTLRKKYGSFLKDAAPEEQSQFSIPMSVLTNKLVQISQMIKINPDLFRNVKIITQKNHHEEVILEKNEQAKVLEVEIKDLKEQLENSEDENTELQDELDEKISELQSLKLEAEELLKKRGLQIVAQKDLPKKLQKLYARNQEITPLMAALHAEIGVETTSEEKRKELVEELCKLDDERRANWDAIDDWSEGKEVKADEGETKPAYDSDPVLAGMQIARRIDRLKENIKRSQDSAENGKSELIRTNAAKRVEAYRAELAELEDRSPKEAKDDTE